MSRHNTRLTLKNSRGKKGASLGVFQQTDAQLLDASQTPHVKILHKPKSMDREIHFFSQPKDTEIFYSIKKMKVKSERKKGIDLIFQSKVEGEQIDNESQQGWQKNLNFFNKEPQQLIYKRGPVFSEKKYLKQLLEIDQSRQNGSSLKEFQSESEKVKQEDVPSVQLVDTEKKQEENEIFFFREPYELPYSKLLWFKTNFKNGRNIVYNSEQMRCQPVFKCEGCLKTFDVPSALGGHLSRCDKKDQHFRNIARKKIAQQMKSSNNIGIKKLKWNQFEDQPIINTPRSHLKRQQEPNIPETRSRRSQRILKHKEAGQQEKEMMVTKTVRRINRFKEGNNGKKVKKIRKQIQLKQND